MRSVQQATSQPTTTTANPITANPNVRLTLLYSFAVSTSGSLLNTTPLAAFILLIRDNSNSAVGVATGIQGLINLLMALPIGALSDRIGRQALLRTAAGTALVAAAFTAVCLLLLPRYMSNFTLYYYICGACALWGLFMGLHSAPLDALFADSVPSGARSRVYVWRSQLRSLGQVAGPLISILIFGIYGDTWRLDELRVVLLAGVAASLVPTALLCCFRDDRALGGASEGLLASETRRLEHQTAAQAAAALDEQKVWRSQHRGSVAVRLFCVRRRWCASASVSRTSRRSSRSRT